MRDGTRACVHVHSWSGSQGSHSQNARSGVEQNRRGLRRRAVSHNRPLRTILLSSLLAFVLLAGFSTAANATQYDMRGEWTYTLTCTCGQGAQGSMVITQMEPSGSFTGTTLLEGFGGPVTGTLSGTNVTLDVRIPSTPIGEQSFATTEGTLDAATNTVTAPIAYNGGGSEPTGTVTATKIHTLEEVEKATKEKEEQEQKEREKEEQEKIQKAKEQEKIKQEKEAQEKQAAKEKAEQEEKERPAKEAKAAQEAKEKSEKEAKAAQEAKTAQEAKEKAEKEAKAAQEAKAAKEREEHEKSSAGAGGQPALLVGKTFAVSASGQVSLELSNANGYSVSGGVTLTASSASKASATASKGKGKGKAPALGDGSFTISAHGTKVLKLTLSKSAIAQLKRHKTLRVLATITTHASGQPTITKSYSITLQAAHKHH
jgi:outer membrane biosynthesis protein TonB